ncbi:MAG TPA: hypothetical protein VMM84_09610, partial [Pyrinomonadaceae bacterium]|nr:hypothetical protein [Pyrinomonadaceae bacterium]
MKKRVILALTLVAVVMGLTIAYSTAIQNTSVSAATDQRQQGKLLRAERAIPGHYIVVLNEKAGDPHEAALALTFAHGGS